MPIEAQTGMVCTGTWEVRSGFCSVCGTCFDDEAQAPQGDGTLRYCPKCKGHRQGMVKASGKVE
jgi:phage-related protein